MKYIIIPFTCYLIVAFANASFNLAEWNPESRGVCSIAMAGILIAVVTIDYLNGPKK